MSVQAQLFNTCVAQIGIVKSYAFKSEIIHEEDAADRIYEVISGAVCTYRMLKEGRRQIVDFYFSGDIFRLEAAEKHILAAEAVTDSNVRIAKKQALNVLISRDAKIADQLLSLTARELSRKQDQVLVLSRSAEERVICFLIEMSKRISPKDYLIALPMTRQHIADYLGLTIETISRILHDLERRGAIKIKGYRSIALRNQFIEESAEELPDLFEGIKGRQPKTKQELDEWLVSPEGRAIASLIPYLDGEKKRSTDQGRKERHPLDAMPMSAFDPKRTLPAL